MNGPWRDPPEESDRLYSGLVVDEDRVTGSVTIGKSRLALWALIGETVREGYDAAQQEYPGSWRWTTEDMVTFLYSLLELRGEFGRLLLVLANAERLESNRNDRADEKLWWWWERPRDRRRVLKQLRRCVAVLEAEEKGNAAAQH